LLHLLRSPLARFDICRAAAVCPELRGKPTLRGHRRLVEIDPNRTSRSERIGKVLGVF
jgi:hypothetical protein